MISSMVNKISKAKQYAEEPSRVTIRHLEVDFSGDNDTHSLSFDGSGWSCSCDFFSTWHICSHSMAVERLLDPMLKVKQTIPEAEAISA